MGGDDNNESFMLYRAFAMMGLIMRGETSPVTIQEQADEIAKQMVHTQPE